MAQIRQSAEMITVTGKTFDHRDTIRALGGFWNNADRCWQFNHLTDNEIAALRAIVGVFVTVPERQPLPPAINPYVPDDDEEKLFIGNDETYRHHFAESDPLIYWGFDSLEAFIDHVATIPRAPYPRDKAWTGDAKYTGTASLDEALQIARDGWLDALGMADLIELPPLLAKHRFNAVAGGTVNVGRMLAGAPDHMTKRKRAPGRKILTLFVETVAWVGIRHDVLLIRALAVAAIVDNLERHGHQCNIVAVYSFYRNDWQPMQLAVQIKTAGERLNLANISFAFGHASFGRRLVYAMHSFAKCYTGHSDRRGFVGEAFNDDHPPGRDEFYIPQIRQNVASILGILKMIEPTGLPVKIVKG